MRNEREQLTCWFLDPSFTAQCSPHRLLILAFFQVALLGWSGVIRGRGASSRLRSGFRNKSPCGRHGGGMLPFSPEDETVVRVRRPMVWSGPAAHVLFLPSGFRRLGEEATTKVEADLAAEILAWEHQEQCTYWVQYFIYQLPFNSFATLWMFMSPRNSYAEILTFYMLVLGGGPFRQWVEHEG